MPNRLTLFDDFHRTDQSHADYGEGSFAFLNRSARVDWAPVRSLMERWYTAYPPDEARDLRGRFRSDSPGSHFPAWWELYVFTLLRALGFEVEVHPRVPGTDRRPDFRAVGKAARFYVEAVSTSSGIIDERRDPKREAWIMDAINSTSSRNFFVHVDFDKTGLERPSQVEITRQIDPWLASLDPDEVSRVYEESHTLPELQIVVRDWSIRLGAWPKSTAARKKQPGRLVGIGPITAGRVDDVQRIRSDLDQKRRKYGNLRDPLIVASSCLGSVVDDETISDVLFGDQAITFDPDQPGSGQMIRKANGLWKSSRAGPTVAAVLAGPFDLLPWTVARRQPSLWLNPSFDNLSHDWFPFRRMVVEDDRVQTQPAASEPWELLGLSPEWPGAELA